MQQKKILIVEDNDLNRKLFFDLLTIQGHEILTLKEGAGAKEVVLANMPDLILMDIQLSSISGIDIIKDLKSDLITCNIPIIAVTAFAMKHEEAEIINSGCDLYLAKPVSIDKFYESISFFFKK